MIAKFIGEGTHGEHILEVQHTDRGVMLSIFPAGEEQIGQHVTIEFNEIEDLIQSLRPTNN